MKELLASLILVSSLTIFVHGAFADSHPGQIPHSEPDTRATAQTPYVTMNIGVEIAGLERAADEAAQGLNLIGTALHDIANNPELSEEHQQQIGQSLRRVDELGHSLTLVVQQLPATVEKSMAPVVRGSNALTDQIKRIVIITAIALLLIILAALAAVYYSVLAPGTRAIIETTSLLNELANTLKSTAEIVETSSEQNLRVLEEMRKLSKQ